MHEEIFILGFYSNLSSLSCVSSLSSPVLFGTPLVQLKRMGALNLETGLDRLDTQDRLDRLLDAW